ncbi:hypothetical protein C8F04DRAFT_325219 [Mycena alexandri]|uniref:F-box domain-containing protein n=1 Tax=Mycena alexandri TaxID=1745969 RepID=A0AAD6S4N0_9AGAR|nr:hypothetical protein C8F04DRAFT_325219 [Mycena alexandri]
MDLEPSNAEFQVEKTTALLFTLPTEIVCKIFTHFLPTYPLCPPLAGPLSPTLLTHVYRQWREIAIATPSLWRAITFSTYGYNRPGDGHLHIVKMWLQRSGGYPLSLEIIEGFPGFASAAVELIIPHAIRWEYVKFHSLPTDLHTIEGSLPLLRQLDLGPDCSIDDPLPALGMPLLRTVALDCSYAELSEWPIALPWAQLTSLTIINTIPERCAPLLQQTPNLIHCTLDLIQDAYDDLPHIILPFLKSLVLTGEPAAPTTAFLAVLEVPALRTLHLPHVSLGEEDPSKFLASFISNSGCTLQELGISGPRSLQADDAYRQAFPSIPKFSFS